MLNVVIDTSIYRQDPERNKAGFTALSMLCEQGIARLHLPFFVEREFISNRVSELSQPTAGALQAVRSISRRRLTDTDAERVEAVAATLSEIKTNVEQAVTAEFEGWVNRLGVERHEIDPGHGRRVADAYFRGESPFRVAKNRNDFPDAFIWETIKDIAENLGGEVYVIVADGELLKCCRQSQSAKGFASFDDFFASDDVKTEITDEFARTRFSEIVQALSNQTERILAEIGGDEVDALAGKEIIHPFIPSDSNDATINSVGEAENCEFDFESASYFGNGIIVIPFSFDVEADADFYIFKSDYYCMSEERQREISVSDWNDHYYQAEDNFSLTVHGHVAVKMPVIDFEDMTIEALIEQAEISIDSIDSISVHLTDDY